MCFSLETKTNRFDCLACHCRAACVNGECMCERGFLGNGLACVPDPYDCINYPGVCHMNGRCNNSTRRCECNTNYAGNGYDCQVNTLPNAMPLKTDTSFVQCPGVCSQNSKCLNGACKCLAGYVLNPNGFCIG